MSITLFAALLVAPSPANPTQSLEEPLPVVLPEPSWPLAEVGEDGDVWAVGSDWKLHVAAEGAQFFPRVGPSVEASTPLALRVARARLGDRELALAARPDVSLSVDRMRVDVDHGAFVETWHLRADEVEQTFRFDRLDARAELSIVLETSAGAGSLVRDGGALRFEAGPSVVRYGRAITVDAAGRRADVSTEVGERELTLVVPAAEVAAAELPLVVDPVLSTGGVGTPSSLDLKNVDVTYDPQFDVYVVVADHSFSASDRDAYAYVVAGSGSPAMLSAHIVDITTSSWHSLACVRHGTSATVGIVAAVRQSVQSCVGFRRFDVAGATMGPQRLPYTTLLTNLVSAPDIGADPPASIFGERDNYLVVFSEFTGSSGQSRIRGLELDSQGFSLATSTVLDSEIGTGYVGRPSISPRSARVTGGNSLEFVVAWERLDPGSDSNIRYGWIRSDGGFPTPGSTLRYVAASRFRSQPSVGPIALVEGRWRCSIGHVIDVPGVGPDIEVATVEWGGATDLSNVSIMEGVHREFDQFAPALSAMGGRTSVAYLERPQGGSPLSTRVRFASGDLAGRGRLGLAERKVPADGGTPAPDEPSLALRAATGGQSGDEGLLVWPARGRLYAARVRSMDLDIAGHQYCLVPDNSTGEPGWMRVVGQPGPGAQTLRLEAYDLPQSVFGYFLCSLGSGNVSNVGGSAGTLCLSGVRFGRFASQVNSSGPFGRIVTVANSGALPQAMGTTAALAGETWCFQCWHRDTQLGQPISNLTNAVAVEYE